MLHAPCLLRLDSSGLDAWHRHGRRLAQSASFVAGAERDFGAWLARQPARQRYRLLVDLAEEGFEIEDIPRVRGADRRALLVRRLAEHFPDPGLAAARSLGAVPGAPHLERVLLHGLTRPVMIAPWLAALDGATARLEAVIPGTALLDRLVPRALRERGGFLLLSFGRGGMRLSHFDSGRLRYSRLTGGSGARERFDEADWPAEVLRTRNYLAAKGGRRADAALPVIALARERLPGKEDIAGLRVVDPASLGHLPALEPPVAAGDLTPMLLWALASAPRKIGWPSGAPARTEAPARARLAIPIAGGAFFVGCVALAAMRWSTIEALARDAAEREHAHRAAQREIAQLAQAHAGLPLPPQALIDAVTTLEREQVATIAPTAVLRAVAGRLESLPELRLERLSWRGAGAGAGAPTGRASVSLELRPLQDGDRFQPATRLQFELGPGGRP